MDKAAISFTALDAIAVTKGPGLLGSLHVGVAFAKGLALSLNIPIIEVHHMHAHILSHFATSNQPSFPYLCLTVSGGHTQIVKVSDSNDMQILGSTIDDAAGEAFDKTGIMLGLPYPAGPEIDRLAKDGKPIHVFSKPHMKDYEFSFSGFKTSVLYYLREKVNENPNFIQENLNDLCASIQQSIVDILMIKLVKAANETGIKEIAIAGGVAANSGLKKAMEQQAIKLGWNVYLPPLHYCTDNAAMIGIAGYLKFLKGEYGELSMAPDARMEF
jgi:N6-L-threonylcarbamoyladenine synthase